MAKRNRFIDLKKFQLAQIDSSKLSEREWFQLREAVFNFDNGTARNDVERSDVRIFLAKCHGFYEDPKWTDEQKEYANVLLAEVEDGNCLPVYGKVDRMKA